MPMDRLLEKLRQNMAELSIQGDDFTRQIWHMYATFEEFLDNHTTFGRGPGGRDEASGPTSSPDPGRRNDGTLSKSDTECSGRHNEGVSIDDVNASGENAGATATELSAPVVPPHSASASAAMNEGAAHLGEVGLVPPLPVSSSQIPAGRASRFKRVGSVGGGGAKSRMAVNNPMVVSTPQPLMVRSDLGLNAELDAEEELLGLELGLGLGMGFSRVGRGGRRRTSQDDMSLVYRKPTRGRYRRGRRQDVVNPLLETISAIEDMCESDDYSELPGNALYPPTGMLGRALLMCDGDRDSIGYAGSNSIDSGYKSSCPTPDLSDGTYYYNELGLRQDGGSRRTSIASQASVGSQNSAAGSKPRISMGTKVIGRQQLQYLTRGMSGPSRPLRSSDPGYYDSTLDHLLHLRQSILNAMRRYDSVTMTNPRRRSPGNLSPDPRQSTPPQQPQPQPQQPQCPQPQQPLPPQQMVPGGFVSPRNQSPNSRNFPSPAFGLPQRPRSKSPLDCTFRPRSASASSRMDGGASPNSPSSSPLLSRRTISPAVGRPASLGSRNDSRNESPLGGGGGLPPRSSYPNSRTESPCFSSGGSAKSSPGYSKTVRFNSRLDANAARAALAASSTQPSSMAPSGGSIKPGKTPQPPPSSTSSTSRSKPILKDPLCANLRNPPDYSPDDPTLPIPLLEEEIDTFLYGSTRRNQDAVADAGGDLPCSYVTMIEDNYRRSSLARVKRLRERSGGESSSSGDSNNTSPIHRPSGEAPSPSSLAVNQPRFTEMAQCMLEIIDNLQNQKLSPEEFSEQHQPVGVVGDMKIHREKKPEASAARPPPPRGAAYQGPSGASDYHVYEEIMYELMTPRKDPVPPPLPARPTGIFRKLRDRAIGKRLSEHKPQQPKQRSNLYSLFSDQSDRRSLSKSLESELVAPKKGSSTTANQQQPQPKPQPQPQAPSTAAPPPEDEYGFHIVKHVM